MVGVSSREAARLGLRLIEHLLNSQASVTRAGWPPDYLTDPFSQNRSSQRARDADVERRTAGFRRIRQATHQAIAGIQIPKHDERLRRS
jgi:hypothetical protein